MMDSLFRVQPKDIAMVYLLAWTAGIVSLLFNDWHFALLSVYLFISGFRSEPEKDLDLSFDSDEDSVSF